MGAPLQGDREFGHTRSVVMDLQGVKWYSANVLTDDPVTGTPALDSVREW